MKDTILAQTTPVGNGGVGIIRISGQKTKNITKIILGKIPKPRFACYTKFFSKNKVLDEGIAIWFPHPNSYTGEDVLELHCHGGQIILNILIKSILNIPETRIASPGEFTERAFLNNKIDLIQAESIMDLISASSEEEADIALNALQGKFSFVINNLLKLITEIRSIIEASIDFIDEEIDHISEKKIFNKLKIILKEVNNSIKEAKKSQNVFNGIKIVIVGGTNVGKSSLINKILNKKVSIVTPFSGTTRDIIKEYITINGIKINIRDTAGLRDTKNVIELIGIKNTIKEIKNTDHLFFVIDGSLNKLEYLEKNIEKFISKLNKIRKKRKYIITVIYNKIDVININPKILKIKNFTVICLSAKTGKGLDLLINHLKKNIYNKKILNKSSSTSTLSSVHHRHLKSLKNISLKIKKSMLYAFDINKRELLAEELKLAQYFLGEITGKFTTDNLLNNIFSNFCIGK